MKTCLQMGLTNVRHAMVGSLGLEKNWRNTIKSNMVQGSLQHSLLQEIP